MFTRLGFIVDDLSSSQINYCLVKNCNNFIENESSINIQLFFEDNFNPCVPPKFARFNVKDAFVFDGHLIATSLKTAKTLKTLYRPRKYFYINDLEYLRKNTDKKEWNEILKDENIIKFARCNDYIQHLFPYKIHDKAIVDFHIPSILEIINDSKRA